MTANDPVRRFGRRFTQRLGDFLCDRRRHRLSLNGCPDIFVGGIEVGFLTDLIRGRRNFSLFGGGSLQHFGRPGQFANLHRRVPRDYLDAPRTPLEIYTMLADPERVAAIVAAREACGRFTPEELAAIGRGERRW